MASPPLHFDHPTLTSHAGAEFFCRHIGETIRPSEGRKPQILVVGCGTGHEAAYIQRALDADVCAIDENPRLDGKFSDWPRLNYRNCSAEALPFPKSSFDAVFCYHVLEHVSDASLCVSEIGRVVRPDGSAFLGTPNRGRLFSAIGGHEQSDWKPTLMSKLGENMKDWGARLRGRFHNKYGAHAGFTIRELNALAQPHFAIRRDMTRQYLIEKYQNHRLAVLAKLATLPFAISVAAPSVYLMCSEAYKQ